VIFPVLQREFSRSTVGIFTYRNVDGMEFIRCFVDAPVFASKMTVDIFRNSLTYILDIILRIADGIVDSKKCKPYALSL